MTSEMKCSKCGGALVEGFIIDHGHMQLKQQQIWVEGQPESSFWSGIKTSGRTAYKVQTLRCTDCYFLEFYTNDEADLDGSIFT